MYITCEIAPWEDAAGGETTVPEFIGERMKSRVSYASLVDPELVRNRIILWSVIQLALADAVPDETLFRSPGPARSFTLRPDTRSSVPLQRVHVGAGTIPNSLADIPCSQMTAADLLTRLNSIIGTERTLDTPGLQDLIEHVRNTARDFGEVYSILRPWWLQTPSEVLRDMEERRSLISRLREDAIQESWIKYSSIPPRRVWDLYSNRVLPFHLMRRPADASNLITNILWTISHSWVADIRKHCSAPE